ncbi:LysE family transporter [Ornithinimicrobium avium]|uniref:LysE family translocator n=1 Tax=Ornithinimicrobium avium TaxID=2283195 RepID=A0A345NNW0_9MICO|nr:LysE family transporter [Ornithinimicrobium avium]AXH96718.1 LysE family translocator [Ornithinimicrobium avium]
MTGAVAAILTGLGIGLAAGVSPGPLLVLVITSTLHGGLRHGLAVAAAPLLSDLVVVTAVLLVLRELGPDALGWLGVVGGVLVVLVGVQTVREARTASLAPGVAGAAPPLRTALRRAVLVNLFSPHPWLSWITVLGPLTVSFWRGGAPAGVAVVLGFYLTLVGSKAALAAVVARGRRWLTDTGYRRTVTGAGVVLMVLGVVMLVEFGRHLV